jgi:hypothetical protein
MFLSLAMTAVNPMKVVEKKVDEMKSREKMKVI